MIHSYRSRSAHLLDQLCERTDWGSSPDHHTSLSHHGWDNGGMGSSYHHPYHPGHEIKTSAGGAWHHLKSTFTGGKETVNHSGSGDSLHHHLKSFHSNYI